MPQVNFLMTARSRRVLDGAKELAESHGNDHIGTEHILLALTEDEEGIAAIAIANKAVVSEVRDAAEQAVINLPGREKEIELDYSPSAHIVLDLAQAEAQLMKDNRVNPGHLLLGLLAESKDIAARVLITFNMTLSDMRPVVAELLGKREVR